MNRLRIWEWLLIVIFASGVALAFGHSWGVQDAQARWNDNYLNSLQADRIQRTDNLRWFRAYVDRWDRIMRGEAKIGIASFYSYPFHGRQTASGEIYDMMEMTAASRILPLGTIAIVKNMDNGRICRVRINDVGPFWEERLIDLSFAAAQALGMVNDGIAAVRVTPIPSDRPVTPGMKGD